MGNRGGGALIMVFNTPLLAAGLAFYSPCSFGNNFKKTVTKTRKMENTKETKKFRVFVVCGVRLKKMRAFVIDFAVLWISDYL